MEMPAPYTVRRCKKDDTLYGPIHGSPDGDVTLCGQETDHNWWILTNDFSGKITCKKCLEKCPQERAEGFK